ncbi:Circularly permutated [Takifugu flavidus]|uniref:Circularly permutated n=1 Tax=Takifugu flavidus TaxID=433684 RepID=A0A5C6NAW7_9TELE|nr:Circularly permutated [Takifugu flavidus]
MEFACSHVVCNWRPDGAGTEQQNVAQLEPDVPPLPPRRLKKPRPTSLPLPPLPSVQSPLSPPSLPPPVPPRADSQEGGIVPRTNVNVISLNIGKLVDMSQAAGLENMQSPVICEKCSAALSCLIPVPRNRGIKSSSFFLQVWTCEFCGCEQSVSSGDRRARAGQRAGTRSDDLYLLTENDDDYQNVEDAMVVFCVDISGSMSVTTEVTLSSTSKAYISRLESIQDAIQKVLSSLLEQSPRRRVALVTFNNEVEIYGNGIRAPLVLRDWALIDYEHIWQQGVSYGASHCIAETCDQLKQAVNDLREQGATSLGPAVLASVAVASRYPGSKVILCTDGRANIGLGKMEDTPSVSSSIDPYFYKRVAQQAVDSGVIISVMTFEGTDCCLADIGRLADSTGGRVNIVSVNTVATEIQLASMDNVLATNVTATLLAAKGVYFPYERERNHKLVREIGNVTSGLEITFQFAVKSKYMDVFLRRKVLPFQLQLTFKTREQQKCIRILTEQRPVTSGRWLSTTSLNMVVLGVHCAQLCASLTMEGRVEEAQRHLNAQQDLHDQIRKQRPIQKDEIIYSNWMDSMVTICAEITTESMAVSDEAAKVIYQMKRATSTRDKSNTTQVQKISRH